MAQSFRIRRVAIAVVVALVVMAVAAWHYGLIPLGSAGAPNNSILLIVPYKYGGTWVFDDSRVGLVREPFVGGVPEMMDVLVADIPDADNGFRLYFSANAFPGYQKKLTWTRKDSVGNYYRIDDPPMEGWICPALFKYYRTAPPELYVKAEPKE